MTNDYNNNIINYIVLFFPKKTALLVAKVRDHYLSLSASWAWKCAYLFILIAMPYPMATSSCIARFTSKWIPIPLLTFVLQVFA